MFSDEWANKFYANLKSFVGEANRLHREVIENHIFYIIMVHSFITITIYYITYNSNTSVLDVDYAIAHNTVSIIHF